MSSISDARANIGLTATGIPSTPTASGAVIIGVPTTQIRLGDADVFYAIQALIAGSTSDLVIDLADGDKTGSTAWTAGAAQVETNTIVAASGATASGNLALVVTSAGMEGTPLTVNVALTTAAHTSAALIAAACRETLAANAAVSEFFAIGGTGADIQLTRKPSNTYSIGNASVPVYLADDATANLAIPSALGVTASASSTNTTEGVASAGCYVVGVGVDFEGNALLTVGEIQGIIVKNEGESPDGILMTYDSTITDFPLPLGSSFQMISASEATAPASLTIEPVSTALITIIVAGTAA
jgi:hypothetical protein